MMKYGKRYRRWVSEPAYWVHGAFKGLTMLHVTIDIEVTNRCNADCYFCPRDETPHEGLMSWEVFEKGLERAIEARELMEKEGSEVRISLCGLGEPLLNPRVFDMAKAVKDAGFFCHLSSNGAMLNERRRKKLIESGIDEININIGDIGEDYENVYHLPFEKTQERIVAFAQEAEGVTQVNIVLVDYKVDVDHRKAMMKHWRDLGINNFVHFDVQNRGGALVVDEMQYGAYPEEAEAIETLTVDGQAAYCGAPFFFLFIGYDGQYYLCCSDWRKQAAFGSVFETSFLAIMENKQKYVMGRTDVCKQCNLDPVNQYTSELRAVKAGRSTEEELEKLREKLLTSTVGIETMMRHFSPYMAGLPIEEVKAAKRRLPFTVV